MRIAIVEDNRPLADGLAKAFETDGHGVDQLHDGRAAIGFLTTETVDLIILDINLPGASGTQVLRELRTNNIQTPVLMLTARGNLEDKVEGLDTGADDYLTKPFDLAELKARARALLRRADREISETEAIGAIEINFTARRIHVDGELLELPRREYALAEILARNRDRIISKSQIIEHLYGTGADVEDSTIELYVHRLRKKFSGTGCQIKTARGLGYCLREAR